MTDTPPMKEDELCPKCGKLGCKCDPETCDCEPQKPDRKDLIESFEE